MTVMHTEAERLAMIREALERLTAAATGLFEDWQQARSFLPSGCRKLMEDLTFEQASWLGRFEHEVGEGTSFSALESFEGFAANVRRLVSEHAASPLAVVGEVFESDDEERLFFRRWKNFLDAGIGTIARSFVIDDIIFAGQIAASMRLVGLLRRITAEWAHLSPEHRHQLGIDFRENAQALSDAYGTASSADFILMKERFADRLKGEFEGFLEAADHPVDGRRDLPRRFRTLLQGRHRHRQERGHAVRARRPRGCARLRAHARRRPHVSRAPGRRRDGRILLPHAPSEARATPRVGLTSSRIG